MAEEKDHPTPQGGSALDRLTQEAQRIAQRAAQQAAIDAQRREAERAHPEQDGGTAMIPDLTPKHRQQAEALRDRLNALIDYGTWGAGYALKEPDAITAILAYAEDVRRLERERILGKSCPCKCANEPWHQRGVCREGEAVLMGEIRDKS